MSYTKGPWEVGTEWNGKPRLAVRTKLELGAGSTSFEIAVLGGSYDELKENAQLLAAAPELLEALIEHHSKVIHTMQIPNNCPTCALIAKATGGTE